MNLQPRDYQDEARTAILRSWGEKPWYKEGETYRSCVLNIPTSSGKTVVAGMVAESVSARGRFLYLADRDELCDQPIKKFAKLLGIHADLDKADSKASRLSRVVVGSVQTLSRENRLARYPRDHFQYIFVDEAHRSVEQAKAVTDYFHQAKVCGQTATAFRAKLKDLSSYYETVAYELRLFKLIDEGYIVPLKVLTLPVHIDLSGVHQSQRFGEQDYDRTELASTMTPYYEAIAELIVEHASDRQIVAFLPLIKSSQEFTTVCRSLGIKAEHIDFKSTDREEKLHRFENREFQIICNSSLLTTGWDCPPCDALLNLTPTRSLVSWFQKVGRIGRVLPGTIDGVKYATARKAAIAASEKPNALILDLLYHADRFGVQGPADLVAANVGERQAIIERLAENDGEFLDLEGIARDVQAEREAKLKEELERAAKRKAQGLVDAQLYAAMLHNRGLLDYEPVSAWHSDKITDKQAEYLMRNGIDPATVKDKGHASMLTSSIFARKAQGLCSYRTIVALEKKGVPNADNYSEQQAYNFLQGAYPFPFGKEARRNATLDQVMSGYWRWLSEQDWVQKEWPILWDYMQQIGVANRGAPVTKEV